MSKSIRSRSRVSDDGRDIVVKVIDDIDEESLSIQIIQYSDLTNLKKIYDLNFDRKRFS